MVRTAGDGVGGVIGQQHMAEMAGEKKHYWMRQRLQRLFRRMCYEAMRGGLTSLDVEAVLAEVRRDLVSRRQKHKEVVW